MGFRRPENPSLSEETEALIDPEYYANHEEVDSLGEKSHYKRSRWSHFLDLKLLTYTKLGNPRPFSIQSLFRFIVQYSISTIIFLMPSFVTSIPQLFRPSPRTPKKPLSPTAYLDGLRGVAALVVYVFHWSYLLFPFLRQGWGSPDSPDLFIQQSIVRVLHSGRASVTIFFVISGYVITIKTLSMIHNHNKGQQPDRVLDSLSGSLLRRPLRLYLPIVVSITIILVLVRWEVFEIDPSGGGAPPYADDLESQLQHWWTHLAMTLNPFRPIPGRANIYGNPYNGHLWTIPVEFKGSCMVFLFLLAFARAKRWIHLSAVLGSMYWLAQLGDLDMALFCAGLVLAEMSLVCPPTGGNSNTSLDRGESSDRRGSHAMLRHIVTITLFMISLHLMSYPELDGPDTPGFRTLSGMVPEFYTDNVDNIQWFWISIGSVLFVVALMYSPPVTPFISLNPISCCAQLLRARRRGWHQKQEDLNTTTETETDISRPHRDPAALYATGKHTESSSAHNQEPQPQPQPLLQIPFTTPFAQYLGRISYSLYLAHGAVNHSVGTLYLNPAWAAWRAAEEAAGALRGDGMEASASAVLDRAWAEYVGAAVWATVANTVVLFWVSDVFWRGVDVRCVAVTRWVGNWASRK